MVCCGLLWYVVVLVLGDDSMVAMKMKRTIGMIMLGVTRVSGDDWATMTPRKTKNARNIHIVILVIQSLQIGKSLHCFSTWSQGDTEGGFTVGKTLRN